MYQIQNEFVLKGECFCTVALLGTGGGGEWDDCGCEFIGTCAIMGKIRLWDLLTMVKKKYRRKTTDMIEWGSFIFVEEKQDEMF